ncbi:hypothetical protein OIV83_003824 [Microbotryomycetes sp. JL201]|nr:hypothetical protein OIV83_003824 [Microbotryomycetes sp. JL201]
MVQGGSPLIGVAICVAGNTCISVALNVQKLAHKRLSSRNDRAKEARQPDERSRLLPDSQLTPEGIPPEPARLTRTVSDPQLNATDESTHLLPNAALTARPSYNKRSPSHSSSASRTTRTHSLGKASDAHSRSGGRKRPRTDKMYLREPLWWLGISLMALGEFGNFLSYAFAPASLVAPLGSVALVANVGLAPLIVKEASLCKPHVPFRKRDLLGCLITFLGGATVVYSSRSSDKELFPDEVLDAIITPLFLGYAITSVVCIAVLAGLSRTRYGDRFVLIDLGICALSGGFTVLSTKAISSFLTLLFLDTFRYWITYPILAVLVTTALVQVNFINKALQRFESRVVIPIQFMTFALSTIVGSAVLYREFDDVGLPTLLNFAFGCAMSALGVWLITKEPTTASAHSKQSSAPDGESASPSDNFLGNSVPKIAIESPVSTRRRQLSLTLGGSQYVLAHSPHRSSGYFHGVHAESQELSDDEDASTNGFVQERDRDEQRA